ncbi:cinnamoyl-CoA reductase-like SNL6 [Argentina anserina]|uniref:cinnamoyl-CoA reductase-like SNL6 n=1 Tax=Argentina anserina TaxID=57926 RepID=UPI002176353A|nr:cinnamoyl-CoA reductase-like SNL6 [Potentilla anserina]
MAPAASNPFDDHHHHTMSSTTVCVMDASGHLGSTLVWRLVQRGYTVHAALQSHGESKLDSVTFENNKRLKIFHLDPFDYQSIVDALKGCSGLFYTFEPPQDQPDYDSYAAEEEVRAAHNVLEACTRTETIDKVVLTSSVTAVVWRNDRSSNKTTAVTAELDERHWSDVNFCHKFKLWHALSKTLAEKTAWAMAMDRGLNMVSMNVGLMLNPDLSITNPYLKGAAEMYEDGVLATVDVNFVADAHICVYEDVTSFGRYLCFNNIITQSEDAINLARKLTPSTPASLPQSNGQDVKIIQERISNKKLNKLMVGYESISQVS